MVLTFQSPTPDLIAIEELERGLQPYLMKQIIQNLRKLANGKLGSSRVQAMLATRSAELLEFAERGEVRALNAKSLRRTRVRTAPSRRPVVAEVSRDHADCLGDTWLSSGLAKALRHPCSCAFH